MNKLGDSMASSKRKSNLLQSRNEKHTRTDSRNLKIIPNKIRPGSSVNQTTKSFKKLQDLYKSFQSIQTKQSDPQTH